MSAKVTTLFGLASGTDASGGSLLDSPAALVPSEGDEPPSWDGDSLDLALAAARVFMIDS